MIFRTLAITTAIAGITLTEGVIITFTNKKSTNEKSAPKENNKKTQPVAKALKDN